MVMKLVSTTFWSTFIWTATENISMILGPEYTKAPYVGEILSGKVSPLEMAPLAGSKQRL
jgi:hypothetical protein